MLKSLKIEPEKCTSCMQCELACSYQAEGVFNISKSRIKIFSFHEEGRFVPYTCTQCSEAWCMQACPVEAIVLNPETGAKEVLADACVGCKVCTIACPFGTVNYDSDSKVVYKCDLCGGDPECAKACPTQAITYVPAEQTGLERMRAYAAQQANLGGGTAEEGA